MGSTWAIAKAAISEKWLTNPPKKGTVRYIFEKEGPLGLRLSSDVPPWILEVRDGSLAAKKAPRVPLGGVVVKINLHVLDKANAQEVVKDMGKRPLALDVIFPEDQARPTVTIA